MADHEIVLLMGPPSASKRSRAQVLVDASYTRIVLGKRGERDGDLPTRLRRAIRDGQRRIVVEHTVPARRNRTWIIDLARKNDLPVRAELIEARIEQVMTEACHHLIDQHGRLLEPEELQADDTLPSPSRVEAWFADFERPSLGEGLVHIDTTQAAPIPPNLGKPGLLLDLDGTIRRSRGRAPFPRTADDVVLLPARTARLRPFVEAGVVLAGVSNQGGVGLGQVSQQGMREALARTVELLGLPFDARACPHDPRAGCWCRKPRPGLGVVQMRYHALDPARTWVIGDRAPDRGLADSLGLPFVFAKDFFAAEGAPVEALLNGRPPTP